LTPLPGGKAKWYEARVADEAVIQILRAFLGVPIVSSRARQFEHDPEKHALGRDPMGGNRLSDKIMLKMKNLTPKQKAPFRMLFLVAFLAKGLGKLFASPFAKIAIALCLAGVTAGNAAETVPIKRASPEAFRPSIVRDAVEAADWMAKSLTGWGYKADFSLESLKDVDRFIDEEAPDGKPKPGSHLAQQFGAQIFGLGAYVGETIRRQGDGQWEGNDRDTYPEVTLAVRLKSGTVLWPTQRVLKRLEYGSESGLYPYGVMILSD
jgi:hypothetical protein